MTRSEFLRQAMEAGKNGFGEERISRRNHGSPSGTGERVGTVKAFARREQLFWD